jgi:hypothetical protein
VKGPARKTHGDLTCCESINKDILAYTILSRTWLVNNNEEASFQDIEMGIGKSKAAADGLRYFGIDTCCTVQTRP